MQRRSLLRLGLGGAALLTLVGGGLALMQPGLRHGRLTPAGRAFFAAVARAVLDGALPVQPLEQRAVLDAHLDRLDGTLAGLAPHARSEVSQLVALLNAAPGRIALSGLRHDWAVARVHDVQVALQAMRVSTLMVRQQAYHALRDLTNAAYFADPGTWRLLGYPGQRPLA
jgi:hypothetical protein